MAIRVWDIDGKELETIPAKYLDTGLKAFNYLLSGDENKGIPSNPNNAIFGAPGVGKTLLSLQVSCYIAKEIPALFIDLESFFASKSSAKTYLENLVSRFDTPKENLLIETYMQDERMLEPFFAKLGIALTLPLPKVGTRGRAKGKIKIENFSCRLAMPFEQSYYGRLIKERNIGFVVIDGIHTAIQLGGISKRETLPLRADIMRALASQLGAYCIRNGIPLLYTMHHTQAPTMPPVVEPWGGDPQGYLIKNVIRLKKGSGSKTRDEDGGYTKQYRVLQVWRSVAVPERTSRELLLQFPEGFKDIE